MPLRVNNNISGINTQRQLKITNMDLANQVGRLSSGLKVIRTDDDAAGLSVSEGLRAEISSFLEGIRNSEQATNLLQVAEGTLNAEFTQLISKVDRVAQVASHNNTALLAD